MLPLTIQDPFRVQLIFHDELENVQVVPLNGLPIVPEDRGISGTLRGRAEVSTFVTRIGFDSFVKTRQVSDIPNLAFQRIFYVLATDEIVPSIEARSATRHKVEAKILDGQTVTEQDAVTLMPFEAVILGATNLESAEGFQRMRDWLKEKDLPAHRRGI